ncbi:DNA-binding protein [Streptococcus pneumoniae]|nr:DNA-binding protein [Streptococcus pneumoniae]CZE34734.1 DNA-binding protein [Streptococcus pneumoniae]VJA45977.1 DNA-binding protein [Streptococcus pneumoniae]VJB81461.1 DNA-binding protein [Streptococcus pneumoniae]VLC70583.1 DNA-binding protein [Streptococcus pneumoniae]
MNTIEKVKQWFIDRDLENGRVVGLMASLSKRRIMENKDAKFCRRNN